ncbi:Hint domain-containing protein [Thioclava sp. A2]|uniref:Hint domain-containing protein n=1 Tax=Thioclava sp. FCG-A2 TaxID=3080562 RepID=UPI00295362DE|nr:Hint domain-containing protein [Thioclava sp. A2]MDV7270176.1 Hint domain-containing protein [Thioclava sp. A2]
MSFPHRAAPGYSSAGAAQTAPLPDRLPRIKTPAPKGLTPPRPVRAMPMTRRYEAMWLTSSGDIDSSTRIAPATPLFEEAFSALARGAVLTSECGPVAIEDVVPGMRVLTADGAMERVTWVGSMMLFPNQQEAGQSAGLTRITAEAMGPGRPLPDLVLGPRARICLRDARLRQMTGLEAAHVPARAFIDGVSVIEVTPASPVTVYHLVLERHATLKVLGLEVESYHPGEGLEEMIDPRMLSLFEGMFPQMRTVRDFGPLALPRLTRFEVEELLG